MKTNLEAILTTMVGGMPVTRDGSKRAMDKLLLQNRALNANLPFVESKDRPREEVLELNRRAKTEKLLELCPSLESVGLEVEYATKKLAAILRTSGGEITDEYIACCDYVLGVAEKTVGKKTITLEFENEVQA